MTILVTGAAGFIGFHTALALLERGDKVLGLDNLNAYYDPALKAERLKLLESRTGFAFARLDLADRPAMEALFERERPDRVVHLAAQAGVRYSIENPWAYIDSNLAGFMTVLEGCRRHKVRHLVFASSSSVYGGNIRQPFSERDPVDHPLSLYAASKKANEAMAHAYAHLYGIPSTGARFFSVYGPWGRPDMALFLFTRAILAGEPIDVFNYGGHERDFTYVDDIVRGVVGLIDRPPAPAEAGDDNDLPDRSRRAPYRLYNIGSGRPVQLEYLIGLVEAELGKKAERRLLPMQSGDVPRTSSDISSLKKAIGYEPQVGFEEGVRRFVAWYRDFYRV